jgi:flavodoxin
MSSKEARLPLKIVLIYESKYGNTKRVAEAIAEEIERVGGMETTLTSLKRVDVDDVTNYDMILLGGPTHFGGPTRNVRKFIDAIGKRSVNGKSIAVFDTYLGEDFEKGVGKMEGQIRAKAPSLKLLAPGLSIRVAGMKGPIVEGELAKCEGFVKQLAAQSNAS